MNRKHFLNRSALFSLGTALMPSTLFTSCRDEELFDGLSYTGKVVVIGAGAAGLYATWLLKEKGVNVTLLEATDRPGGRMGKLEGFADFPIDRGAQWLHGRNSIVGDWVPITQTNITLDDGDATYWFNGQLVPALPKDVEALFEDEDGLTDVTFAQFAADNGFGQEYQYIVEMLAGDQGADSNLLSAAWNAKEEENWSSGNWDYKFERTFYDLLHDQVISKMEDKIRYNEVVTRIEYSSATITVETNNDSYEADKVILALPITVLKDGDIEFIPSLPSEKTEAFSKIGMGPGMKVFMKFSEKFFDANIAGGEVCAAYADDSVGKTGSDNVLLAFVMGQQAQALTNLGSDAAIVQALLAELDSMYNGQASATYLEAHVEDWTSHPYIRGAYSYSTIGIGNARSVAARSVEDKLFFAGEVMNTSGHHQTVHGAVETGYREVINLLKTVEG